MSKCVYVNLTANWQQKLNKLCVAPFDDKLAAKIEHILRSAMQSLFSFCCQFVVKQCYAKLAQFLLPICCQVMYASFC